MRITGKWAILLVAMLALGPSAVSARDVYVSPTGSDSADGGPQTPVASIGRAKAMVRTLLRMPTLNEDIHVKLGGGVYFLDGPLVFTNEDSGTAQVRVYFESLPDQQPRIVGGLTTKLNWQRFSGDVWVADINPYNYLAAYDRNGQRVANAVFRDLYVNRAPAIRARYPKLTADPGASYLTTLDWNTGEKFPLVKRYAGTMDLAAVVKKSFLSQGPDCANASKRHPVEFVSQQQWTQNVIRIGGFDSGTFDGQAHVSLYPCAAEKSALQHGDGAETKISRSPYHLENSLDFLSAANEWYFDAETSKLYYMPPGGSDPNQMEFMIPTLETLISIKGRSASQPVMNLTFSGLTFENTTFYDPVTYGYVNQQASMYRRGNVYVRQPAAVSVSNVQGLVFSGNTFQNLGAEGLQFIDSSASDNVTGNVFHDIGGTCLSVGGGDQGGASSTQAPLSALMSDHDTVSNNRIWSCGTRYAGSVGIFAMFARNLTVSGNYLRYLPYTGISVGWGWNNGDVGMRTNVIQGNQIFDFMRLLYDGAAIYTQGIQPSSEISGNRIGLMLPFQLLYRGYPPAGIYLDEGSDYITVRENRMRKVYPIDNNLNSLIKLNVPPTTHHNCVVSNVVTNSNVNWSGVDSASSWGAADWQTINPDAAGACR
ncbi:hypothetical protein WI36_04155 [Burkholderia ubonensis]|uniref:right-handed parallel beta-helix repeat-containing protein n=1 Tax=Burkholderia ubonensis TaxID=101571 RepID=UPI0007521C0E|nr:right-handed parallel beta-helix repeat-containing protein [Burkholderia ubonensis]KUZ82677.1 hypothetical protein WI36_04155 [Burkholderia ubonensis]